MRISYCGGWSLFLASISVCNAFAPGYVIPKAKNVLSRTSFVAFPKISHKEFSFSTKKNTSSQTVLSMVNEDDGPAFLTVAGVLLAIVILVGTSLAPTMDMMNGSGNSMDYNLSDSVVTRQDVPNKLQDYSNPNDKLSRSKIQEKLNRVPVFYLADEDLNMKQQIYLSYEDASNVASSSDSKLKVKCTTLDQVTYPLIFKRGRMRMAPPPSEVQKVENIFQDDPSKASNYNFLLVPSTVAQKDAENLKLSFKEGDVPLFLADRLAFASNDGPQVPLFLEKDDCVTSYTRLRKAGGNKLPEEPTIRTTTLLDVVSSMEKGSRPAVKQLQFYATENDLLRASQML